MKNIIFKVVGRTKIFFRSFRRSRPEIMFRWSSVQVCHSLEFIMKLNSVAKSPIEKLKTNDPIDEVERKDLLLVCTKLEEAVEQIKTKGS